MVVGGEFTEVGTPGSAVPIPRRNLFAFDTTTGAIDQAFVPEVDGRVEAIAVAPDQRSIYLAGDFETVGGLKSKSIARIDVSVGAPVAGFRPPVVDGVARDIMLLGNRLYVAGQFAKVGPDARAALTALHPATGAIDRTVDLGVAGVHNGGRTSVVKMAVTPDGTRMIVIGNFRTVAGQERRQVAILKLAPTGDSLSSWSTTGYASTCYTRFDSYVRDVAISPDGRYFVLVTTGGYGPGPLCDTAARFELSGPSGSGQQPSWVNYTGGDTLTAVAITGPAVYIGGHQRWMNNPYAKDAIGPGAVPRPGLAALNPVNGLPYTWNPGRDRGEAVYDFLVTPSGLWVTSDTERVGGERRERIAFFPLAGGTPVGAIPASALPGQVYLGARTGGGGTSLARRELSRTGVGGTREVDPSGVDWSRPRGTTLVGGTLYAGEADGTFSARTAMRTADGLRFGPATPVDTADRLMPMAAWHATIPSITAMAYGSGRLYYTVSGRAALYARTFEPQSGIVGAQETVVSATLADLDWRTVGGMFLAGDRLYTVDAATGALRRTPVSSGPAGIRPGDGTTVVSGPAVDGNDWRAQAVFFESQSTPTARRKPAPSQWRQPAPKPRKPAPRWSR